MRCTTFAAILAVGILLAGASLAVPRPLALVVGIETYPAGSGFESVPGSESDARDLAAALDRLGFEVIERRGSAALRKTLVEDLETIGKACSGASGPVLLFFSGRAYGRARGDFVAPYDARSRDLEVSGIELDRWRLVCPKTPALLILDVPAEVRPASALTLKPAPRVSPGRLEIRAGESGRATYYDGDLGGRVLARSLLSGLAGPAVLADGSLDLPVLVRHLDRSIRKWSFDHGRRQTPQLSGDPELMKVATSRSTAGRSGERQWQGQPISLSVKNADLQEVLRSLARLGGVNMVIDPGIRGTVTLELRDVPWDQALEVILKSHGLGAVWQDSILRVDPTAEIR